MKNFRGISKFKQATLAFIATHLTQEEEKLDLDKILMSFKMKAFQVLIIGDHLYDLANT